MTCACVRQGTKREPLRNFFSYLACRLIAIMYHFPLFHLRAEEYLCPCYVPSYRALQTSSCRFAFPADCLLPWNVWHFFLPASERLFALQLVQPDSRIRGNQRFPRPKRRPLRLLKCFSGQQFGYALKLQETVFPSTVLHLTVAAAPAFAAARPAPAFAFVFFRFNCFRSRSSRTRQAQFRGRCEFPSKRLGADVVASSPRRFFHPPFFQEFFMFAQRGQFCFRSFRPFGRVVIAYFGGCGHSACPSAAARHFVARHLLVSSRCFSVYSCLLFLLLLVSSGVVSVFRVLLRRLVCFRSFPPAYCRRYLRNIRFGIKIRICVVVPSIGRSMSSSYLRFPAAPMPILRSCASPFPLWSAGKYVCVFKRLVCAVFLFSGLHARLVDCALELGVPDSSAGFIRLSGFRDRAALECQQYPGPGCCACLFAPRSAPASSDVSLRHALQIFTSVIWLLHPADCPASAWTQSRSIAGGTHVGLMLIGMFCKTE